MGGRFIVNAAVAALLLGLSACGQTPAPAVGTLAAQPSEADNQSSFADAAPADYRLLPTDTISITVFREPDLSIADTPIGADGMIAVPLVGAIRAEGMTTGELAAKIESALGHGYVNNPKVAVNIKQYTSHRVTVEGAVKKPGVYPFVPGSRLSAAIALAEGPDEIAKLDQVAVFRPVPEGITVAKFDYRAMQQGTSIDPVLKPGDRVVVGTSGLSRFWQQTIRALPSFAVFTQLNNL